MIHGITTRLEIDVMQGSEIKEVVDLAVEHSMPAIVVHPDLARDAAIQRGIRQGKFKIIVPIDWLKGEKRGVFKMQGIPVDALQQDGFEILLSDKNPKKEPLTPNEIKTELLQLDEFIRTHLSQFAEMRIVLGTITRDREYWEAVCGVLKDVPAPAFIRTDSTLRIQQSKANAQVHAETVEAIKEHTKVPIKISGNIGSVRALTCDSSRFAVGLKQAQGILTEIRKDPEKAQRILEPAMATE